MNMNNESSLTTCISDICSHLPNPILILYKQLFQLQKKPYFLKITMIFADPRYFQKLDRA